MVKIEVDKNSGFCFGVVYAIQMAEDYLQENERLYCLGDIVHNGAEVKRLRDKGLISITSEEFKQLKDTTVLIRAHGEPPETYLIAMKNNIRLLDASCPVVLKLQNRVRQAFAQGYQIIIYGKKGHPEVNGLVGQTQRKAHIVSSPEELEHCSIDYSRPIALFSQTTKPPEIFYKIAKVLQQNAKTKVVINDTICRQVSNRAPWLRTFAQKYDKIVFVAGKKSSNGKFLYQVCLSVNPKSYFISSEKEVKREWFQEKDTIGICGATSTPRWLMEKVKQKILSFFPVKTKVL